MPSRRFTANQVDLHDRAEVRTIAEILIFTDLRGHCRFRGRRGWRRRWDRFIRSSRPAARVDSVRVRSAARGCLVRGAWCGWVRIVAGGVAIDADADVRELHAGQPLAAIWLRPAGGAASIRASQHYESVGYLASGIAHGFNNLLTAVLGNLRPVVDRRCCSRRRTGGRPEPGSCCCFQSEIFRPRTRASPQPGA